MAQEIKTIDALMEHLGTVIDHKKSKIAEIEALVAQGPTVALDHADAIMGFYISEIMVGTGAYDPATNKITRPFEIGKLPKREVYDAKQIIASYISHQTDMALFVEGQRAIAVGDALNFAALAEAMLYAVTSRVAAEELKLQVVPTGKDVTLERAIDGNKSDLVQLLNLGGEICHLRSYNNLHARIKNLRRGAEGYAGEPDFQTHLKEVLSETGWESPEAFYAASEEGNFRLDFTQTIGTLMVRYYHRGLQVADLLKPIYDGMQRKGHTNDDICG